MFAAHPCRAHPAAPLARAPRSPELLTRPALLRHTQLASPLCVSADGFAALDAPGVPPTHCAVPGTLLNANTLDDFKERDKAALLQGVARAIWDDVASGAALAQPERLLRFLLLTFADLKTSAQPVIGGRQPVIGGRLLKTSAQPVIGGRLDEVPLGPGAGPGPDPGGPSPSPGAGGPGPGHDPGPCPRSEAGPDSGPGLGLAPTPARLARPTPPTARASHPRPCRRQAQILLLVRFPCLRDAAPHPRPPADAARAGGPDPSY